MVVSAFSYLFWQMNWSRRRRANTLGGNQTAAEGTAPPCRHWMFTSCLCWLGRRCSGPFTMAAATEVNRSRGNGRRCSFFHHIWRVDKTDTYCDSYDELIRRMRIHHYYFTCLHEGMPKRSLFPVYAVKALMFLSSGQKTDLGYYKLGSPVVSGNNFLLLDRLSWNIGLEVDTKMITVISAVETNFTNLWAHSFLSFGLRLHMMRDCMSK